MVRLQDGIAASATDVRNNTVCRVHKMHPKNVPGTQKNICLLSIAMVSQEDETTGNHSLLLPSIHLTGLSVHVRMDLTLSGSPRRSSARASGWWWLNNCRVPKRDNPLIQCAGPLRTHWKTASNDDRKCRRVNVGNQPTDLTMVVASLSRQQSDSSGLWRLSSDNAGHSSAKILKVSCLIVDMDVHFVVRGRKRALRCSTAQNFSDRRPTSIFLSSTNESTRYASSAISSKNMSMQRNGSSLSQRAAMERAAIIVPLWNPAVV